MPQGAGSYEALTGTSTLPRPRSVWGRVAASSRRHLLAQPLLIQPSLLQCFGIPAHGRGDRSWKVNTIAGWHRKFPGGRSPSNEAENWKCHQIGNGSWDSSRQKNMHTQERLGLQPDRVWSSRAFTFLHFISAISHRPCVKEHAAVPNRSRRCCFQISTPRVPL